MALRPSKITSDIFHSCTKYLSTSADATIKSKITASLASQNDQLKIKPTRYRLANAGKPEDLPELNFQQQDAVIFAELQPSATPEFRFDLEVPKWAKEVPSSPFPEILKKKERLHMIYTDQQKAEDKMLKYKMTYFSPPKRNFSTVSVRRYSKGPAENSGSGKCSKKPKKCSQGKKKVCRPLDKDCPRFRIGDCEQSKGSNCKLNYLDPNCEKKFAPYPSYSESCAENLPDDPSECQQCPWRTCDGVDTIEPGKPARHKRHYSTSCSRHLQATTGVVGSPASPPPLVAVQEHLFDGKCNRTNKPCKEPLGPCEVRKQREEKRKQEKEIHVPPKPKKASEELNQMVLNSFIGENDPNAVINPYTLKVVKLNLDQPLMENPSSWIDIIEHGEEMFLTESGKHPNCHRKKKPKRPKTNPVDKNMTIEYGNADWWSGRGKKTVIIGNQVLVALHFCATGSYQLDIGYNLFSGISQPSISRRIAEVSNALNRPEIFNQWVRFSNTIEELNTLRRGFFEKYQFPGVIGVIDGTHVAIVPPNSDDPEHPEHIYVNRKGYHSINTQLICDSDMKIINVSARFPGSLNDLYIWEHSSVKDAMENLARHNPNEYYLLGDSGYILRLWIQIPIPNPEN